MNSPGSNQSAIAYNIIKRRKLIGIVTIVAAIAGAIFYWTGLRKYEATTEFILRNPTYSDKNNLYSGDKTIDYFAGEDDIDKIIMLSGSDLVQSQVIHNMHLATAYKMDSTTRRGELSLEKKFNSNLRLTRTEFKGLLLGYTDTDPVRAAEVANETVHILEKEFGGFYKDMRRNMYQSVMDKIHDEDSSINALTDTLSRLRNEYGIYDLLSPGRGNILGTIKSSGHGNFGMAVEKLQNIESLKDELVVSRSRQTTLANQFATGNDRSQMPMLKVVTEAKDPVRAKGPGGLLTVIICAFLGMFFSIVYILLYNSRFWEYDEANGK